MMKDAKNTHDHFLSMKENILWLTVVMFVIASIFLGNALLYVLFFWSLKYLFENNIRRISGFDNVMITFLRRSMYWFPLIFPIFVNSFFKLHYAGEIKFVHVLIALIASVLVQIPHFSNWSICLSYDFISCQKKNKALFYIMEVYSAITAAIFEELFFRGFLISVLKQKIGFISIIIATFLFFLHHYECKWASNNFKISDYINQTIFGLIFGTIYYVTNDLYVCIFGHLVFNSLSIILNIRKYIYFYLKKDVELSECN